MVKNTSIERQIAKGVVNSLMKNGKRNNRGQFTWCALLLVILGVIWGALSGNDSQNDNETNVEQSSVEQNGEQYNWDTSSEESIEDQERENVPYSSESTANLYGGERVTIERCVDGDTFVVINSKGVRERVRLIGANTPETVKKNWPIEPFGPEASEYTKRRVAENGNVAILVSDGSAYDRYNRRLAFMYLGNETISLNEDLCRKGLAKAETQYSYSKAMKERLTDAATAAARERLGIYSLSE